ncbi:MAG: hypothetical protein V7K31_05335 [Nostoc sp.]
MLSDLSQFGDVYDGLFGVATQNFSILAILCPQNVTLENYGLLTMP